MSRPGVGGLFLSRSISICMGTAHCQVYTKKNGQLRKWIDLSRRLRLRLGMQPDSRPWTDRASVIMRGIPRQSEKYSFVDELLNTRWAGWCKRNGISEDTDAIPDQIYADIRQASTRQLVDGRVTLLSRSKIYHFKSERVLESLETMFLHGWPDSLHLGTLGDKHEAFEEAEAQRTGKVNKITQKKMAATARGAPAPPQRKRNRNTTQYQKYGTKLTDLAGNAVSLADMALLTYSQALCSNSNCFKENFEWSMLEHVDLSTSTSDCVIIDAFAEENQILAMRPMETVGEVADDDGSEGDSDCDED